MTGWSIPPEFPLNELVGQEVTQICIGFAQVQIHFYRQPQSGAPDKWKPGARIDVESAFTLERRGSTLSKVEPQLFKSDGRQLAELLGETVVEVHPEPENELLVAFTNEFALRLHTDPQGFESFHLQVGGESITVTGA
jgi:Family of unknown function (DUF6188)